MLQRVLLTGLLIIHGSIHLLGFVQAFGLARVPALAQPIPRHLGVLWGMSAVGFLVSAALFVWAPRFWPWSAAPALVLSQFLILRSWGDAKFGTIGNILVLVPLLIRLMISTASGSELARS